MAGSSKWAISRATPAAASSRIWRRSALGPEWVLLHAGKGLAALELHEQQERRLGLGHPLEAAALGDQRLDRQLGRQAAGDVAAAGDRAGLVVDDPDPAVTADLDPIGAGAERERPARCVEREHALHLAGDPLQLGASAQLHLGEPGRDPLEARPPHRPDLWA